MPTGNLPASAKALWEDVYEKAKNEPCKGDESCAAKRAWGAVKNAGWKKDAEGKWHKASLAEFSLTIVKAAFDKPSGEMRWSAVASDTDWDSYEERMSLELFSDFVKRADSKQPVPKPFCSEAWCGGLPYPSVAHYMDLDGKGVAGETRRLYVDGNRLKASGIFYDTPLGRACFKSVCNDLYDEKGKTRADKVRISIGFLDYAHAHGDVRFERKSLSDECPMCAQGANEKTYLKGHLLHLALTRVPVNKRTDIIPEVEVKRAMTTRKEDAASIVGEELAEELERESQIVGKSEAYVERADEEVVEETPVVETPVEAKVVEEPVKETPEPEVTVPQTDDLRQELSAIKSTIEALASVLLAKHGKGEKEMDEEECTEEMKKEGKCKEHMKESKAHVLDSAFDVLRADFDAVREMDITEIEKLQLLQEAANKLGEALRANITPERETVTESVAESVLNLDEIKSMVQAAIQPLADQVKLLSTQLTAKNGAEAVTNSMPQRRSISPLVVQKAQSTVVEKPNSFSAVAKRSVGLPL